MYDTTIRAVTFQCYAQGQCGNSPESVMSYLADGESVCCNGSYLSWRVESDGNPTCNPCPIPGRYMHAVIALSSKNKLFPNTLFSNIIISDDIICKF